MLDKAKSVRDSPADRNAARNAEARPNSSSPTIQTVSQTGQASVEKAQRGVTGLGGVGQKDPDLAVVHIPLPAAPLAAHAARFGPLLGKRAGIDDHDAVGPGEIVANMLAQFGHHGFITLPARAHEELDRLAGEPPDGDRLAGLPFQAADQPADDQGCVTALFGAIEMGRMTL